MTGFNKLTKKDYQKSIFRSYFLQNGFNYTNYQALGYALLLYPSFEKIYGKDSERFYSEMEKNCEFYNTSTILIPFITSIHLAMADSGLEYEEIRGIKMALMGPMAGIGDSISQFMLAPLFSTIFAGLALDNVTLAPIMFLIAINATLFVIKYVMGEYGRKIGTSMIDKLSSQMNLIADSAGIVGVAVIAGLVSSFVKMKVSITYAAGAVTEGVKTSMVDIQAMLDKMAPALLPILYTALMYYLIKKKGWSTYKLVILTVILGVVLSVLGILA